ncbi:MAG: hypothetical protein ACRDEB_02050 [Chitinophagaceae bacterium]
MRKIFFSVIMSVGLLTLHAQQDSLQQYAGKYIFPEGSPVTEIMVTLDSSGLTAISALGSSELRKIEGDDFSIIAYGGLATFKRNAENKISGVHIIVGDINMVGTKKEEGFDLSITWRTETIVLNKPINKSTITLH